MKLIAEFWDSIIVSEWNVVQKMLGIVVGVVAVYVLNKFIQEIKKGINL